MQYDGRFKVTRSDGTDTKTVYLPEIEKLDCMPILASGPPWPAKPAFSVLCSVFLFLAVCCKISVMGIRRALYQIQYDTLPCKTMIPNQYRCTSCMHGGLGPPCERYNLWIVTPILVDFLLEACETGTQHSAVGQSCPLGR